MIVIVGVAIAMVVVMIVDDMMIMMITMTTSIVIMMMIVGLKVVVIVMAMAGPVIVPMAVTLVFRVMTVVITPLGHKHPEVLWTVGMVMARAGGPVVQQRVSGK